MLRGVNKCFMLTGQLKVKVRQRLMTRQRQVKIVFATQGLDLLPTDILISFVGSERVFSLIKHLSNGDKNLQ